MTPYTYFPNYQQLAQNYPAAAHQQTQGFVSVRNELEARNYPIAPGNSITFVDESQPYCYTKTASFNQLDRPIFKRYRLVEEPEQQECSYGKEKNSPGTETTSKITAEINILRSLYERLKTEINELKGELGYESDLSSSAATAAEQT